MLEVICSNAAPLRHLGVLKQRNRELKAIDLLHECFSQIIISSKVYEELSTQPRAPPETASLINDRNFVKIHKVQNLLYVVELERKYNVGLGERETLATTKELCLPSALVANRGASHMFAKEGVPFLELIDFLEQCKTNSQISEQEHIDSIKLLHTLGYRPKKYEALFRQFGII